MLPRPPVLPARGKSEWAAPYPLGPSAGTEVGGAVRQGWGCSESWNVRKSTGKLAARFLPAPGGLARGAGVAHPRKPRALPFCTRSSVTGAQRKGTVLGLQGGGGACQVPVPVL